MNELRYFDAFAGIGGFSIGIERAIDNTKIPRVENATDTSDLPQNSPSDPSRDGGQSTTCVGFSEIDKYASQVLKYKYPNIKNYGDITQINPADLPDFDLFTGGFPCQSFSIAGLRKGFEDTRGTLFFEIARILADKRPRYFLLENVKGLLSHDSGKTFQTILKVLTDLGYDTQWAVLNAKDFGVPQNRERVFFAGCLGGWGGREVFSFGEGNSKDIIQLNSPTHSNTAQGGNRQPKIARHPLKFLQRNQKNIEGDYAFTVDSANTGGIRQDMRIRRLTPTECERLMSFPDGWTKYGVNEKGETVEMSSTQRYKQCGNGVVSNCVQAIIENIILGGK